MIMYLFQILIIQIFYYIFIIWHYCCYSIKNKHTKSLSKKKSSLKLNTNYAIFTSNISKWRPDYHQFLYLSFFHPVVISRVVSSKPFLDRRNGLPWAKRETNQINYHKISYILNSKATPFIWIYDIYFWKPSFCLCRTNSNSTDDIFSFLYTWRNLSLCKVARISQQIFHIVPKFIDTDFMMKNFTKFRQFFFCS